MVWERWFQVGGGRCTWTLLRELQVGASRSIPVGLLRTFHQWRVPVLGKQLIGSVVMPHCGGTLIGNGESVVQCCTLISNVVWVCDWLGKLMWVYLYSQFPILALKTSQCAGIVVPVVIHMVCIFSHFGCAWGFIFLQYSTSSKWNRNVEYLNFFLPGVKSTRMEMVGGCTVYLALRCFQCQVQCENRIPSCVIGAWCTGFHFLVHVRACFCPSTACTILINAVTAHLHSLMKDGTPCITVSGVLKYR